MDGNHPLRPPPRPYSPAGHRSNSSISQRSESSLSIDSDNSSIIAPVSITKRPSPLAISQPADGERPSTSSGPAHVRSTPSQQSLGKQARLRTSVDGGPRLPSPNMPSGEFGARFGHRPRQQSQGYFEPTLPSASLSASQIAAQAAMHPQPPQVGGERKRSVQLASLNTANFPPRKGSDGSPQVASAGPLSYSNGLPGGSRLAATTAANVAFPHARSPIPSPTFQIPAPMPPQAKEKKPSKMKLFSKPKNLNLSKDREAKIGLGAPSPGKGVIGAHVLRGGMANASTTSVNDTASSASSLYSSANASTSTLVPSTSTEKEKDKDRHRPGFLSRSKHKAKDEHTPLPLSSAASNSQAVNPDRPMPLYSFTPDSPSTTSFAKTMSNFGHSGRALREKKKEEKAAAANAAKFEAASLYANHSYSEKSDMFSSYSNAESFGPSSTNTVLSEATLYNESSVPSVSANAIANVGSAMGVPGLGPDDVWPLLKSRLLYIFSGDSVWRPVEELNILVSSHIERCVRRKLPLVLIEDLAELLHTGFSSLAHILRATPEERLVIRLVEMWENVHRHIVPFMQAVFLPLDLEFRGRGTYLTAAQAKEFWSNIPEAYKSDDRPASADSHNLKLGDELEIKRITLIAFRDTVILPRHETLTAIFSRLSLGNINTTTTHMDSQARGHSRSDPAHPGAERPDTAGSLSPHMSSYNSQASTLLDAASTSSGAGSISQLNRSRATSNTSAGSFGTNLPHLNPPLPGPAHASSSPQPLASPIPVDPKKITQTVATMLQCLSVLTDCQTGDVAHGVVARLTNDLKYNWLGRGRTGGNRKGWVGAKTSEQRVGLVAA
ncbi:hypothetical protein MRB53_039493 [Persea americana]|nr:hypothetical protein MRB53_039493 [Persea americana]